MIDQLKAAGNASATEHSFEYRPWGMFENLLDSEICKVKRLTVDPAAPIPAVPPQALRALASGSRHHRAAWRGALHTEPGRGD